MSASTLSTTWGEDAVAVTADWAQASAPIAGLDGVQVADVRHSAREALWRALDRMAIAEGETHSADCTTDHEGYDTSCPLCRSIEAAMP